MLIIEIIVKIINKTGKFKQIKEINSNTAHRNV
jgi:hypothetical protein